MATELLWSKIQNIIKQPKLKYGIIASLANPFHIVHDTERSHRLAAFHGENSLGFPVTLSEIVHLSGAGEKLWLRTLTLTQYTVIYCTRNKHCVRNRLQCKA